MTKYVILALIIFSSLSVNAKEETRQLDNLLITKLASSYEFTLNLGLYGIEPTYPR